MGQGQSLASIPLATLPYPLCVTDQRFCSPTALTLMAGDDLILKDIHGTAYFQRQLGFSKEKILLDFYGNHMWTLTRWCCHYQAIDSHGHIIRIYTETYIGKIDIECQLSNKPSGQTASITMDGNSFAREAGVFIGNKSDGRCIVKLSHPRDQYVVEIAPQVDSSFAALMCLVLEEEVLEGGNGGQKQMNSPTCQRCHERAHRYRHHGHQYHHNGHHSLMPTH